MTVDEQNAVWAGERSDAVAAAIRALTPAGLTGIDYGCGPGHVGLRLIDHFASLSLVDASADVVSALGNEVAARPSLQAHVLDLTRETAPEQVDCIFASMSFHHVVDTDALLDGLARTIRPGGWLIVADLDADDGDYHSAEPGFDGHDGFDRRALAALVGAHGFTDVRVDDLWSGRRWSGGVLIDYSLFVLTARRTSLARRRHPAADG